LWMFAEMVDESFIITCMQGSPLIHEADCKQGWENFSRENENQSHLLQSSHFTFSHLQFILWSHSSWSTENWLTTTTTNVEILVHLMKKFQFFIRTILLYFNLSPLRNLG
jgi:hypothetical protein